MKIRVVDDKEYAEQIRKRIKENDGYCPCRLSKTPETKCMCKEFLSLAEEGYCHCGLYYKIKDGDDQ